MLTEAQAKLLAAVDGEQGSSSAELRTVVGLGPRDHVRFRAVVLPLVEAGLLQRTGRSRTTRYWPAGEPSTPTVVEAVSEAPRLVAKQAGVLGAVDGGSMSDGLLFVAIDMRSAPEWLLVLGAKVSLRPVD